MKIIFLNVWGNEMRDELVSYIEEQAFSTDIFCFQEATDGMKLRCERALVGYNEISNHKYISNDDNFEMSMFIKKDIELVSSGTLFADDMRFGLALYAEIKMGDRLINVCNAFGRARPSEKMDNPDRLQFSLELIKYFENNGTSVIIGGDFNLEKTTESVGVFERHGYRNLIADFNIQTTRNHLVWDRFPDNKMYYSDYAFLNSKVQLKSFEVVDNEVSDHLPLILEIEA
jgi:endonuclease/exonuclease/phosphatase family metal-dependent hydrolase